MRRGLVLTAAAVALAANLWGVYQCHRNRAEARGGRLELTEEELRFEPPPLESTAILLHLQWRMRRDDGDDPAAPAWLDQAKLTELGFDFRVPASGPGAKEHYTSTAPRPAYLVLERAVDASNKAHGETKKPRGLVVVDAGPEPSRLRARHPDSDRSVIARGVVRLAYVDYSYREKKKLESPRLEGRIENLLPSEIAVPLPCNRLFRDLRRDATKAKEAPAGRPRFRAIVCWGANYEPWIAEVRLAEPSQ